MKAAIFTTCPRCGATLEDGFAIKNVGLSFVEPSKLEKLLSMDEDISGAGYTKFLPAKAEYFDSYLCRRCEMYLIDYSTSLDRNQARELARYRTGGKAKR